ncbi:MAG: hypothetical protein ACI3YK_07790 [Eubacteriales bacterium]
MRIDETVRKDNQRVLTLMSRYLNIAPDFIEGSVIRELTDECGLSVVEAYAYVLAAACGLKTDERQEDRRLFEESFLPMVHRLSVRDYTCDPYYRGVPVFPKAFGRWRLETKRYKPYEAFVCGESDLLPNGRLIPKIGFFEEEFRFPALLEDGREWMLITPNEIETMKGPISDAFGNVLCLGLGMGYYAYRVSEKENVGSVCIVERDSTLIEMVKCLILPQFSHPEKIRIVCSDAFDFAKKNLPDGNFDFVFTDLWHDPSDGVELYQQMKNLERLSPRTVYSYWIEKTLRYYQEN